MIFRRSAPEHTLYVAFVLAALSFVSGCGGSSPATEAKAKTPVAADANLSIILSGDTAGFIVPCGCTSKQFGGLPRRGTFMVETQNPSVLYLDAGGSVSRATDYDAIKLEYIWKGVMGMKPAALNLGAGEILLGLDRLKELAKEGVPLVSANVTASGELPWKPFITATISGAKIAVTGVCLSTKTGPALQVQDAERSLRNRIPELAKSHDAVVLLCYGEETDCIKLIGAFPELTAVLAAGTSQPIPAKLVEDRTILSATANKGKFLARVNLSGRRNQWKLASGDIVELSEKYADHKDQVANLTAYKERLKKEKLDPARTGEAPALLRGLPKEYRYAGNKACAECHVADAKIHAGMKHAIGLETLIQKGFDFDPYCLKCHTTGYGGPGGFVSADTTPALGGIGCESCHGPSQGHANDPRVKTTVASQSGCITCHDPENDPHFDYAKYWPKIEHGKEKAIKNRL